MIVNLSKTETAVLLLHMAMMRKSARNTFKRNYGKESKEMLSSFDEVKNSLDERMSEEIEEEIPEEMKYTFHYNIKEINMLHSFLESYVPKLEENLQAAGEIMEEDQKQIDCLREIEDQTARRLEVSQVV